MKVYIIISDKDVPLQDFADLMFRYRATGQVAELNGANGYNIRAV